jgi:hypothetical protein
MNVTTIYRTAFNRWREHTDRVAYDDDSDVYDDNGYDDDDAPYRRFAQEKAVSWFHNAAYDDGDYYGDDDEYGDDGCYGDEIDVVIEIGVEPDANGGDESDGGDDDARDELKHKMMLAQCMDELRTLHEDADDFAYGGDLFYLYDDHIYGWDESNGYYGSD